MRGRWPKPDTARLKHAFDLQRQLPSSFVVSAGLIGSRGLGLQQNGIDIKQLNPTLLSLTFTDPSFGIINQQANYSRLIQLGLRFFL